MKTNHSSKLLLSVVFMTVLSMLLTTSCTKEEDPEPPELPPYESMVVDFSEFMDAHKSTTNIGLKSTMSNDSMSNWQYSSSAVFLCNLTIAAALIVPTAAFYASFNNKAEYLGNNKWQWSYEVTGFTESYYARLTGKLRDNDVKWEMFIRKEGINTPHPEFKWFEGTSDLDGQGGDWVLYRSYELQEEVLTIDWSKSGNSVGEITYTYVRELNDKRETDQFKGSYLTAGYAAGSDYDAYYDIHWYDASNSKFIDVDIEWHSDNFNGRVKNPDKFNDSGEWHCWNTNGINVDCQ